jgi:hypothetical protein
MEWFPEFSSYVWPMAAFATGVAAWFVAMLVVLTKPLYFRDSTATSTAVQRFHTEPTLRIGGVALYFSGVRQLFPRVNRTLRNSMTGTLLWMMSVLSAMWAIPLHDNTSLLVLCTAIFALAYQVLYVRLVRFGWHRSWTVPIPKLHSAK